MLNSAAGVMLPSAIEPPISTMRSTFAPPVRSSSRAMFVSGPVGTSVTGSGLSAIVRCEEVDRALARAARGSRVRSAGPSRPLSPCTWEATVS